MLRSPFSKSIRRTIMRFVVVTIVVCLGPTLAFTPVPPLKPHPTKTDLHDPFLIVKSPVKRPTNVLVDGHGEHSKRFAVGIIVAFLYLISNILTSDVPSKEINSPVALGETTEHISSVVVQPFGGGFGGLGVGPFGGFPFGGFGFGVRLSGAPHRIGVDHNIEKTKTDLGKIKERQQQLEAQLKEFEQQKSLKETMKTITKIN
uniref:Uncharacterized protein n=1 Tax=Attheya septentrionalis TaxID=420275 RepID=A0A7S2U8F7_9STRA